MEIKELETKLNEEVTKNGYDFISCTFNTRLSTLNIKVDRESPISLNEISLLSEKINALLEELDPFEGSYSVDLSTLGAEKEIMLSKLPNYLNQKMIVKITNPIKGLNEINGFLVKVDDETITLDTKEKTRKINIVINKNNISKINLTVL